MPFSRTITGLIGALAILGSAGGAAAQAWPTAKPITILVPVPPGPAVDFVARMVAEKLRQSLGQTVVVENRSGASGSIASTAVARAAPDGYTLIAATSGTHVSPVHLMKNLPYDPIKDFTPIMAAAEPVTGLVVNSALPVKSVPELIAYAKANPGKLTYGSSGVGSVFHVMGELLNHSAGIETRHVPYRGVALALQDVIAGHIPMMFVSTGLIVQPWKAGQLRALGVGSRERLTQFPELPTVGETLPGFTALVWFGLFAPNGTPRAIVVKINNAIQHLLADRGFGDRFLSPNLYERVSGSPEQFAQDIHRDAERWQNVIRDAKLAIED